MEGLVNKLIADIELTRDIKIEMLKEWERVWSDKMSTSVQSKSQLEDNLQTLNIIKDGIRRLQEENNEV